MKKILALILASLMLFAVAACDAVDEETTTDEITTDEITTNEATTENEETTVETDAVVDSNAIVPSVGEDTWGYAFWKVFSESVKANPEIATGEIAYNILMSEAGQALGFCENMEMPEGFLPGFSADITGFKSATVFTPAAAGYAFMGYVFELEDSSKVTEFMQTLEANHDLRWMVCMTADMATMGAYNNYVLFVMSPTNMPGVGGADAEILYPDVDDGTYGAEIWNFFEQAMNENPSAMAEEMAYAVAYSPVVPFNMAAVNPVEIAANEHLTNGLDGAEAVFSVTADGEESDLVIYLITIELGLDVANWSSYYVTGEGVVYGAYNNTIIVMYNATDYIQ